MRRSRTARATAFASAIAVALVLAGCGKSEPDFTTHRYDIPRSAPGKVSRTRRPRGIPPSIKATVGDKLVVTNHDDSLRIVAGYPVRAGRTVTIPLSRAGRFSTGCSVHDDRPVTLVVRKR